MTKRRVIKRTAEEQLRHDLRIMQRKHKRTLLTLADIARRVSSTTAPNSETPVIHAGVPAQDVDNDGKSLHSGSVTDYNLPDGNS